MVMIKYTVRELAQAAAEAHTNLAMYETFVVLAESGGFYGEDQQRDLNRIIDIAKKAQQRELKKYDDARAKAHGIEPKRGEGG